MAIRSAAGRLRFTFERTNCPVESLTSAEREKRRAALERQKAEAEERLAELDRAKFRDIGTGAN